MPQVDGVELVNLARSLPCCPPIVVITGCTEIARVVQAIKAGAVDYLIKPLGIDHIVRILRSVVSASRCSRTATDRARITARRSEHAFVRLEEAVRMKSESSMKALVCALDTREHETSHHSVRVAHYAAHLGSLLGVCGMEGEILFRAAVLHDVGKIGVPDHILMKPGPLNSDEWAIMREHPDIGARILRELGESEDVVAVVLAHHERFDGLGYPRGLAATNIPLGSRIFTVCDSYDALTSDRPYRPAVSHEAASREIERCSGTQFDPAVIQAFAAVPGCVWESLSQDSRLRGE